MQFDLKEMLSIARGEISPKSGVTGVAGVATVARYAAKGPELRQLRVESGGLEKDAFRGVIEGVAIRTRPAAPPAIIEQWGMRPPTDAQTPSASRAEDACTCGQMAVLTVYDSSNPEAPARMCRACCDALYQKILRERARQAM